MVYLGARTCLWDVCAGDAIIRASGGQFTTSDGKDIVYDHTAKSFLNKDGVTCSIAKDIHSVVLGSTTKYLSSTL